MIPDLTDTGALKHLLESHGIAPKKSMGQNFLVCKEVLEAAIIAASEGPRAVTELGSGLGALTQALITNNFRVRAIEKDDALAEITPSVIPPKLRTQLTVVHSDIKEEDWIWEEDYQLVGNVPYNISGYIIRRLCTAHPAPKQAILLLQSEVATRLMATPPNMSLLSLAISLWGEAYGLLQVPLNCFWPQPSVSSQLILITPHSTPRSGAEIESTLKIAKPFFQQKRKQMGGIMRREFSLDESILTEAGLKETTRPQEVSADTWEILAKNIQEHTSKI